MMAIFSLSACNTFNSNTNTISTVELTDRENAILTTSADQSFVYDFNLDSDYKEVSVWIEKYESGELVNDRISKITSRVEDNGSIIMTSTKTDNQIAFNIGVNSDDGVSSIRGFDTNAEGFANASSVSSDIHEDSISIEEGVVLASHSYSYDEYGMRSLSADFFKNPEDHLHEIEGYDVVYILKAEFQ